MSRADLSVSHGNDRPPPLVNLDAAGSTAARGSLNRDDALFINLEDLLEGEELHLQAHVGVMDVSPPLAKAVVTVVWAGDGRLGPVSDRDPGVAQIRGGIAGTEACKPTANDLDVLSATSPVQYLAA